MTFDHSDPEWVMVSWELPKDSLKPRWSVYYCWRDGSERSMSERDTEAEAIADARELAAETGLRVVYELLH